MTIAILDFRLPIANSDSGRGSDSERESRPGDGDYSNGQLHMLGLRTSWTRSVHADGQTGREVAYGASTPDGTEVSGSLRVSAKLFPSRFFGYTFLGNAKKVFGLAEHACVDRMKGLRPFLMANGKQF